METKETKVVERQTDFPELERTEVEYWPELRGKEVVPDDLKGVVAGCCYDIGISITLKGSKSVMLLCLDKKDFIPGGKFSNIDYDTSFYSFIDQIKAGALNQVDTMKAFGDDPETTELKGVPTTSQCAFI